jgi:hypothetical protein
MKMVEIGQVDERKHQLVKKEREIGVVLGDVNVEVEKRDEKRDDDLGLWSEREMLKEKRVACEKEVAFEFDSICQNGGEREENVRDERV